MTANLGPLLDRVRDSCREPDLFHRKSNLIPLYLTSPVEFHFTFDPRRWAPLIAKNRNARDGRSKVVVTLVKHEILAFRWREGRKIEARTLRGGTSVEQDQPVTLHAIPSPPRFFLYLSPLFLGFVKPRGDSRVAHAEQCSTISTPLRASSRVSARCNRLRLFMPLLVHRTLNARARHR